MEFELFNRRIHINKIVLIIALVVLITILIFIGVKISKNNQEIIVTKEQKNDNQETYSKEDINEQQIQIHVVGCVKNPGVFKVKKGILLNDVIREAGGLTADADEENINLVYEIKENLKIKIKSKSESLQSKTNSSNVEKNLNSGVEITNGTGLGVVLQATSLQAGNSGGESSLININTADATKLDSLPGIGKSTADKIISYREKTGNFKKKEDLMNISGIGQNKYNKIKDLITVE